MTRSGFGVVLACLIPASAWAQVTPPAPPPARLWIVAGGASGTLRGFCQDCGQDFPFRHGGALVGNVGYRFNPRLDAGADVFWIQWRNESGHIPGDSDHCGRAVRESKGFFVKGGAGMAFVRNWVQTIGPNPDDQKALAVVFGTGWELHKSPRLGLQLFAMQHVGALGDLQTANGAIGDVTANFWSLGAAIVIR